MIIVNADPLQDIKNLDKINTVIQDGRVVELGYHANYSSPFSQCGRRNDQRRWASLGGGHEEIEPRRGRRPAEGSR